MNETLATILKTVIVIALVAAVASIAWLLLNQSAESIEDPQPDWGRVTTVGLCDALGGAWDDTADTCSPQPTP